MSIKGALDFTMLISLDHAREGTEREFAELFNQSGFQLEGVKKSDYISVIKAIAS